MMASGFTPSIFDSSAEITNGFKLMRLIVDGGTEALRKTFKRCRGDDLQAVLSTFEPTLLKLNGSIIKKNQWDKLYPTPPNEPNINDFDITLMCILLRHICGLSPPDSSVWKNEPLDSNDTVEADIVRIRLFRNERFGHIPITAVTGEDFENYWAKISLPLVRLGISQGEIDALRSESILDEQLVCFDFQPEIKMYYEKFTQGTREWVFEQIFAWFHDESSNNRAFVISALAGMGKSVIAAVICNKFAEHIGACHFFQYSNSRYNNPNSLLKSLARQLCEVIPAYKEALEEKLACNRGQSLNDMNVQGLFSLLFKEPFSSVAGNGKRVLIVLDAVDESEREGKENLADLIAEHFHQLPPDIRFLITTRPEKNLIEKFEKLNPLFIEANEERNLNDIKMVLQETFSCVSCSRTDLIDTLVEKSDGLMLYAFFLSEICKDEPSMFSIDHFPKGVGEFYEKYFKRLEGEINRLGISEDTFLSFVSALAVAMEPLPQAFIGSLFRFDKTSPSRKRNVRKIIGSLSSLLVIKENESISFFHKSIRDWLVDNCEHNYTVDEQCGHKILFDLCVDELNDIKKNDGKDLTQASVALQYALKYSIPHMLNGAENTEFELFANNFVADLEVMFACVSVDVDHTLNNISSLMNHAFYKHVSENTSTTVQELSFLVKRFAFLLRDCPQSFLQHVVNECEEELSLKASNLLKTRYKNIAYLELVEKKRKRDAEKFRCVLSGRISGIDVSPKHDYVVCSYDEGGVELFSLANGKSEWKIEDFQVEGRDHKLSQAGHLPVMLPHCIVFHFHKSLILPGRLDMALTLKGTFIKTDLFQCSDNNAKFSNCCFSKDGTKLVTNYHLALVVWNTLSGEKETCLKCSSQLLTFSFTASGKFFGTTDFNYIFTVYDVIGKYNLVKSVRIYQVEIFSTYEQNSWCCIVGGWVEVVSHELERSHSYDLKSIVVPCNLHCCQVQCFLKDPRHHWVFKNRRHHWFSRVKRRSLYFHNMYILIRDESVLIFSCNSEYILVYSLKDLINLEEPKMPGYESFSSRISANGNFVYSYSGLDRQVFARAVESDLRDSIPHTQFSEPDFAIVRDGVILTGQNGTLTFCNCDLTKCEESFDEVSGSEKIQSISEEMIACVYQSHVIFFNVVLKKIVFEMTFTEKVRKLLAFSIKFHVLAKMESGETLLWKDGVKVDGWANVASQYKHIIDNVTATFSPEGTRLALACIDSRKIFVCDVTGMSVKFYALPPAYGEFIPYVLMFFNDKYLFCSSFSGLVICLINVERGEVLTFLDFYDVPRQVISVSRERSIVCAGFKSSNDFELIKVWLPHN